MKKHRTILQYISGVALVLLSAVAFMQKPEIEDDKSELILIVQQNSQDQLSSIIKYDPATDQETELSGGFYSVSGIELSTDAKKVIFSGKKGEESASQIFELTLRDKSIRQITNSTTDCTEPTYLPEARIAYIKSKTLYKSDLSGENEQRLTFHPYADTKPTLLHDGRILIFQDQQGIIKPIALRPDGTKATLYASPQQNFENITKAWEGRNGKIYFALQSGGQSRVMSFHRNDPTATEKIEYSFPEDRVTAVYPIGLDSLMITHGGNSNATISILNRGQLKELITLEKEITEVLNINDRFKAKNLPSRIVENDAPGIIMNTGHGLVRDNSSVINASIEDIDGNVNQIQVSEDGSFYLQVPSNKALKIVYSGVESDWFWVKPGERRGCIGCHESSDYSPPNRVPMAVVNKPIEVLSTANATSE